MAGIKDKCGNTEKGKSKQVTFKPEPPAKKPRKRMKGLMNRLREQVEFYFGDSNLAKDRFMKQKIDSDPDGYVPLELLLTFNKVKEITDDVTLLAKSLCMSDMLQIDEGDARVRRCTPVKCLSQEDVDERTIYVDGLPKSTTMNNLRRMFSTWGRIAYISLPTFKTTGDVRGFALIEFLCPADAARVIQEVNWYCLPKKEKGKFEDKIGSSMKECRNLSVLKKQAMNQGLDVDELTAKLEKELSGRDHKEGKKLRSKNKKKKKNRVVPTVTKTTLKVDITLASNNLTGINEQQKEDDSVVFSKELSSRASVFEDVKLKGRGMKYVVGTSGTEGTDAECSAVDEMMEINTSCTDQESDNVNDELFPKASAHRKVMAKYKMTPVSTSGTDGTDAKSGILDADKRGEQSSIFPIEEKLARNRKRSHEGECEQIKCKKVCQDLERKSHQVKSRKRRKSENVDEKRQSNIIVGGKCERGSDVVDAENNIVQSSEIVDISEQAEVQTKILQDSPLSVSTGKRGRKINKSDATDSRGDRVMKTTDNVNMETGSGKKRRKRLKLDRVISVPEKFRVMSKTEWCRLKKEYLALQKANMQKLKEYIRTTAKGQSSNVNTDSIGVPSKGKGQPEFIKDVIVEVKNDGGLCRQAMQADLNNSNVSVAYIDVTLGTTTGYIRCQDSESASTLLSTGLAGCSVHLVQGESEMAYWEKLIQQRKAQLSGTKRKKRRGKTKLLLRAQNPHEDVVKGQHTKFDDLDPEDNNAEGKSSEYGDEHMSVNCSGDVGYDCDFYRPSSDISPPIQSNEVSKSCE